MNLFAWFCLATAGLCLVLGLFAVRRATRPISAEFDDRAIRMVAISRCPCCGLLVSLDSDGQRLQHIDPYSGTCCRGAL